MSNSQFLTAQRNDVDVEGGSSVAVILCLCVFWFHMWRLCSPYLFLISPPFGTSRGLCFVIVAFPESSLIFCFRLCGKLSLLMWA